VAESLQRGMRVIVQGRLKSRSYDDREGNKRTVFEIDVDEVGPSLFRATAKVTRATRSGPGGEGGGGFGGGGGNQGGGFGGGQGAAPQNDPWATPQGGGGQSSAPQNDPWAGQSGGGSMEEPPF
jgi:single-strand DNA-binding protein